MKTHPKHKTRVAHEHSRPRKCKYRWDRNKKENGWNEDSVGFTKAITCRRKQSTIWPRHSDLKLEKNASLIGFIKKHVGRNWDEAFSKFCNEVKDSDVKRRLLAYVIVDTYLDQDGKVRYNDNYSGPQYVENTYANYDHEFIYYKHPTTGLLCQIKPIRNGTVTNMPKE